LRPAAQQHADPLVSHAPSVDPGPASRARFSGIRGGCGCCGQATRLAEQ
jgi:hypothetical protein